MKNLTSAYLKVLTALDPRRLVEARLRPRALEGRWDVVAVGKAAAGMAAAASDLLGSQLSRGFLLTKHGHLTKTDRLTLESGFEILEAGHPVPDHHSAVAGKRLIEWLQTSEAAENLLVLMSGGASSLLVAPTPPLGLSRLREVQGALLASGMPIERINVLRKHISQIKGGHLGELCRDYRNCRQLTLVDICAPGLPEKEILSLVGSGPFVADPSTRDQAFELLLELRPRLTLSTYESTERALRETPKSSPFEIEILADHRTLAAEASRIVGSDARQSPDWPSVVTGEVEEVAAGFARTARTLQDRGETGTLIATGEPTVTLSTSQVGRGGRCQELALRFAREIAGCPGLALLAGSSDGTDGPGTVAGAVVDGNTWSLLTQKIGQDEAETMLARHDSGGALELVSDCLIETGPTGQNLNDLFLLSIDRKHQH